MTETNLKNVFTPSDDIVAREIEGELIIVPLVAGIGDMEDELFTLNETGKEIWRLLNGKNTLDEVVTTLSTKYNANPREIEEDVIGLVQELTKRRILIDISPV